jgi:hypothetical protein
MMIAEKYGQIEDAKTAREQHRPGHRLNRNFYVRADGMNIVIKAEPENQAAGQQNGEQGFERDPKAHRDVMPSSWQRDCKGCEKRKKNRDTTEPGKGTTMQMAVESRRRQPSVRGRQIAYEFGQNKRKQQ